MTSETPARDAILEAAVHSFLTRGYERTSMERIAKQANVARRTVYNQFENKKALFDATIVRLWRRNPIADIVKSIDIDSSPEDGLSLIGSSIVNFWVPDESIAFLRMIVAESIHFPELGRAFVETGRNPARQAITAYLQNLQEQGRLSLTDADFATAQFVELVVGQSVWLRILGDTRPPSAGLQKHIVDEAVKMFLARYGVKEASRSHEPSSSPLA